MDHNSKQSNLFEINKVITLPLEEEIKQSYLNYAMSVIVGRALPDARDGLKPVQRRILYAMMELGGKVLGKPHSREEAEDMLHTLSGRRHEVVTAVTIRDSRREECFSVSSAVQFCELEDREIDYYIDKFRPYDKAGAYGVQEWIGYVGISRIEGSFYNVMGLPVQRLWQELKKFL